MLRPIVFALSCIAPAASALLLLLSSAAEAQSAAATQRGFVYEIRKGAQRSLLLGTIHVGRPEFYPFPAAQLKRLQAADAIVLEADVSDTARAIAATEKYAMLGPTDAGLDKRLSPALKARIEAIAARNGVDPTPFWRMKPWMLANVLALFEAAQAGYMPALSVEAYLMRIARSQNKPLLELESIEQQFQLFESAPWATQVAFLDDAVKAIETNAARREINRISQAWETGDRAALDRLLAEMRAQTSTGARFTVDTILLGRHPAMIQRIESMMADGRSYVFAVGSLHLPGPQGLVEMLRARGYTVTAL